MTSIRNATAALGLALAFAAVAAAPVLAKSRAAQPGYDARAQGTANDLGRNFGADGVSVKRAQALRDCNEASGKLLQYLWGHEQTDLVRTCMAQHGEME